MWEHRDVLKQELEDHDIKNAAEADAEQYQMLVNSAQGWWTVMRLFKQKQFTTGLLLSIGRTFRTSMKEGVPLDASTSTSVTAVPQLLPLDKTISHLKDVAPPRKPPSSRLQRIDDAHLQRNDGQLSTPHHPCRAAQAHAGQQEGNMSVPQHSQDALKKVPLARTQGTKRHRSPSPEGVTDVTNRHGHPSRRATEQSLDIEAMALACSNNRRLNLQLARFASTAHTLKKDEAGIVAMLLEGLLAFKEKGTLAKVAQGLVDNMPVRFRTFSAQRR